MSVVHSDSFLGKWLMTLWEYNTGCFFYTSGPVFPCRTIKVTHLPIVCDYLCSPHRIQASPSLTPYNGSNQDAFIWGGISKAFRHIYNNYDVWWTSNTSPHPTSARCAPPWGFHGNLFFCNPADRRALGEITDLQQCQCKNRLFSVMWNNPICLRM